MSFILDALRKSEAERQLESARDVMRAPLALPRNRLPVWAVMLIALLSMAVLAISAGWWMDWRAFDNQPAVSPSAANNLPAAETANSTARDVHSPVVATTASGIAPPATGEIEAPADSVRPGMLTGPNSPASVPAEPPIANSATADSFDSVPSLEELMAQGVALPQLELQLHVHSPDLARQFVLINGRRYLPGQQLAEGGRLIAITVDGAIVEFGNRRAFLRSN